MSKDRMRNSTRIEGLLYQHALEKRVTGENSAHPGTEYIRGTVDVATDDALLNVITVHYTYVTATTKKGTPNELYTNLSNILNGTLGCVMDVGAEHAAKVRLDSSVGVNDFYSDRNGVEELVSAKRNEGGFLRTTNTLSPKEEDRSTFDCDMIITGVRHMEADESRGYADRAVVSGYVFDFRKAILPVDFTALNPGAIRYFENLNATEENPVFTRVRGQQVSNTVTRQYTVESAFGDPVVRESTSSRKDFVITWAQPEEYMWNDPSTFTADELKEAQQNREIHLAEVKSRSMMSQDSGNAFTSTAPAQSTAPACPATKLEFDF